MSSIQYFFLSLQCSIQVCTPDELYNRAEVNAFHTQYGVRGTIFPCYYDPNSADWGVVIQVLLPYMRVVHAMVWPTALFVLGSLVCAIFCRRCRAYTRPEPTSTNNPENPEKVQLQPLTGESDAKTNTEDEKADTSENKEEGKRKSKKSKSSKRDKTVKTKGISERATDAEKKPWLWY